PEVKTLVDLAFEGYRVALSLRLPSPALSAGIGTAGAGGLQVDYSSPVTALIESPTRIVWTVTW
ncbi:MAG TPA: hypothetical protein VFL04_05860, partial [Rectinemataceae bacterium]|nr:hypothetical protein [Rectinemataceae bacterium]